MKAIENKVSDLLKNARDLLVKNDINPRDAEYIFLIAAKMDKTQLLRVFDERISKSIEDDFHKLINRRILGEPVAYLSGKKEFFGIDFNVDKNTLIPRPDSEVLVEAVLRDLGINYKGYIIDLGTGSGCLILSILSARPLMEGCALDISNEAILIAKKNALDLNLENRVSFVNQSWNDDFMDTNKFDVIISNPPYIKTKIIPALQKEVRDYEPNTALDGGDDGLDCYRQIIDILPKIAKDSARCYFEIGYDQESAIIELLKDNRFVNIKVIKDLSGNSRLICFNYNLVINV